MQQRTAGRSSTPPVPGRHHGSLESVRLLLDRGARVGDNDDAGRTALFFAAYDSNTDVARVLLSRGARAEVPDRQDESPLTSVTGLNNLELTRLLVDAGANVNPTNEDGKMLLARCRRSSVSPRVIEYLVEIGARED